MRAHQSRPRLDLTFPVSLLSRRADEESNKIPVAATAHGRALSARSLVCPELTNAGIVTVLEGFGFDPEQSFGTAVVQRRAPGFRCSSH
jgi:hypothetical protein